MITRKIPLYQMPQYPFERDYDISKILFFDIETTGLAADSTYLYLIGCACCQEDSFQLIQWFSEGIADEVLLIHTFFEFLKDYDLLIHYNGSGFDLPYLKRKCEQHCLHYSFNQIISIDLYKKIIPYKKIFPISNLKQRSVETFLKISRTDPYNGGDLIEVYQSYLGKSHCEKLKKLRNPNPSAEPTESQLLLHQLLLHNEDDIKGLIAICPILNYVDLFEKPIRILQAGIKKDFLTIHFKISACLPIRICYDHSFATLVAYGNTASLSIQIYEGELKFFYENYRDYYYLPEEDRVIHKSLAQFVDKAYRIKAKPSTCYTKKHGTFVPQCENLFQPCFKMEHQDKMTFLEVHTDFLLQEEKLEQYVSHILKCFWKGI